MSDGTKKRVIQLSKKNDCHFVAQTMDKPKGLIDQEVLEKPYKRAMFIWESLNDELFKELFVEQEFTLRKKAILFDEGQYYIEASLSIKPRTLYTRKQIFHWINFRIPSIHENWTKFKLEKENIRETELSRMKLMITVK